MIFQYYTSSRVKQLLGDDGMITTFSFDRAALVLDLQAKEIETAFRDFSLSVRPGSSLNATRIQKGVLAANLHGMGLLSGPDLLKVLEWQDPDGTFKRAQEEQAQKAMATSGGRGGGLGPAISRGAAGSRRIQSFPAAPLGSSI